jgi:hypothetical protein
MSERVDHTLREEHKMMDMEEIFVPKSSELTKDRRKVLEWKLHDFYSFLNITMVIKSRLMKLVTFNICTSKHKH